MAMAEHVRDQLVLTYNALRVRLDEQYQKRIDELLQQKSKIERKMQTQFVHLLSQINQWTLPGNPHHPVPTSGNRVLFMPMANQCGVKMESNPQMTVKMEPMARESTVCSVLSRSYENSVDPHNPAILPLLDEADDTQTFPPLFAAITGNERIDGEQNQNEQFHGHQNTRNAANIDPNVTGHCSGDINNDERCSPRNVSNGSNVNTPYTLPTPEPIQVLQSLSLQNNHSLLATTTTTTTSGMTTDPMTNVNDSTYSMTNSAETPITPHNGSQYRELPQPELPTPIAPIPCLLSLGSGTTTRTTSKTSRSTVTGHEREGEQRDRSDESDEIVDDPNVPNVDVLAALSHSAGIDLRRVANRSCETEHDLEEDLAISQHTIRFISRIRSRLEMKRGKKHNHNQQNDIKVKTPNKDEIKIQNEMQSISPLKTVDEAWPQQRSNLFLELHSILADDIAPKGRLYSRPCRRNEDKIPRGSRKRRRSPKEGRRVTTPSPKKRRI